MRTQAVCAKHLNAKDDISNDFNFQHCFLFAHSSNHRCNSGTPCHCTYLCPTIRSVVAAIWTQKALLKVKDI